MESESTKLLGMLALLPPNVNRFTATAAAVQARIAYRLDPRPRPLIFVFSALLGSVFILSIVGMFFRLRCGTFRLFTVNSGLIMPQATLMFAFWMAIFCVAEIGSLIGLQSWSDQKKPLPPTLVFLMGTIWIAAYLAVGPWLWSIAAASVRAKTHIGNSRASNVTPGVIGEAPEKNNYRRSAILLNCYAISVHVIVIPSQIIIFYNAAKNWSQALSIFLKVIASLHAASSSYNPSTFSVDANLIPLLVPLFEAQVQVDRFCHFYAVGFGMWAGYDIIFLFAGVTPFFYYHIKQLFMLSKHSQSLVVSMDESTRPASTSRGPTKNAAKPSNKHASLARRKADYITVLMASAAVYAVGMVITILSVVVAVNPGFVMEPVKGAIFVYIAAGAFAFFTPFVAAVFTWRSYGAYREFQRLKHLASENLNHYSLPAEHLSLALPHRVHFDRSEDTTVRGENDFARHPVITFKPQEESLFRRDIEKDVPELHVKLELGEVTQAVKKDNVSGRLTMGQDEEAWEGVPERELEADRSLASSDCPNLVFDRSEGNWNGSTGSDPYHC